MAISKDLRDYINKKRNEKIKELLESRNILERDNRKKALQSDPKIQEIKEAFEQAQSILKTLQEEYKVTLDWRSTEIVKGNFNLELYVPKELARQGLDEIDQKVKDVNKEYDSLILRISMEKNFETINAMLAEIGIDV